MALINRLIAKAKSILSFLNEKGFIHLLTVNMFSQLLSFITLMLVAKFLPASEYGDLKVLQTYVNIFVVIAILVSIPQPSNYAPKTDRMKNGPRFFRPP